MKIEEVAFALQALREKIILVYAFNGTGKTRLSVAYKNITKIDDRHVGVYFNAFSEDLFFWDNDEENNNININLKVHSSSLNQFHSDLTEDVIRQKLVPFRAKFDFKFNLYEDAERGIESISFFVLGSDGSPIKVSRGEERIFIWCLFLAMFDLEAWGGDDQIAHFFIDDPVSSLDEHNIFVTARTIFDLIERNYRKRKIIVTSHHLGLISILYDWLGKSDRASKFVERDGTKNYKIFILQTTDTGLALNNPRNSVLLYHLRLMQILDEARQTTLYLYHFVLLRQLLENIASFLGVGQFNYVLEQIGFVKEDRIHEVINALSHQKNYNHQSDLLVPDNERIFKEIFDGLKMKYGFILHQD